MARDDEEILDDVNKDEIEEAKRQSDEDRTPIDDAIDEVKDYAKDKIDEGKDKIEEKIKDKFRNRGEGESTGGKAPEPGTLESGGTPTTGAPTVSVDSAAPSQMGTWRNNRR